MPKHIYLFCVTIFQRAITTVALCISAASVSINNTYKRYPATGNIIGMWKGIAFFLKHT